MPTLSNSPLFHLCFCFFHLVVDVDSFISSDFTFVSVSFISRRFNEPADSLAKACLCMNYHLDL